MVEAKTEGAIRRDLLRAKRDDAKTQTTEAEMRDKTKKSAPRRMRLLWMQSGGCGGCTLSLIGAEAPDLLTTFDAAGIDVLWHPSLSEATGSEAMEIMRRVRDGEAQAELDAPQAEGGDEPAVAARRVGCGGRRHGPRAGPRARMLPRGGPRGKRAARRA